MTIQEKVTMSTAPYVHNMFHTALIPGPQCAFSGDWVVHAQAWGAYAVNVTRPTWTPSGGMVSPVTDMGLGYQPPAWCECNGDFHQSAQFVVATPNVPKWVITSIPNIGSFGTCSGGRTPAKVQVYQLGAAGLSWHGQVFCPAGGAQHRLDGDVAYIDGGGGSWAVVNLLTLGVISTTSSPPPFTPQPDIQGYSFTMQQVDPKTFVLIRAGGGPVLNCFFPTENVTRQQVAAFLVKLSDWMVDHPGEKLPAHPEQLFEDVPPGHQFYDVINKVGGAGISVGRPCS